MKKSIKHVAVHKSSWILAVCLTCAAAVGAIGDLPSAIRKSSSDVGWTLAMPFVMGFGSYICGLVFFFVYNALAKRFGGIEIELDENKSD
jgi:hypothetical protein